MEPERDGNGNYWRGATDTQIRHLLAELDGVRGDLREIQRAINGLSSWRSKVVGISIGASTVVSAAVGLILHLLGE